jgi:hypothetical protein
MKKIKYLIVFMLMIISISLVTANQEYKDFGGEDNNFFTNTYGGWNLETDVLNVHHHSVSILDTSNKIIPKVAVLDDGNKYIISGAESYLNFYTWDGNTLELKHTFNIESSFIFLSDFTILKENGKTYIIAPYFHDLDYYVYIINIDEEGNLNHSNLKINSFHTNTMFSSHISSSVKCSDRNCFIAYSKVRVIPAIGYVIDYQLTYFNTTSLLKSLAFNIKNYGPEYDSDYILANFTIVYKDNFVYVHTQSNLEIDKISVFNVEDNNFTFNKNIFPLNLKFSLIDVDGNLNNGMEVAVAREISNSSKTWKVDVYDSSLNLIDTFPSVYNINGDVVSQPFQTNCDPLTGYHDIGILAYDLTQNTIQFTCIAPLKSSRQTCIYKKSDINSLDWNLSTLDKLGVTAHSFQAEMDSIMEFTTSKAVFKPEPATFNFLNLCTSSKRIITEWDYMTGENYFVFPIDYFNINRVDMILKNPTSLTYYQQEEGGNRNVNFDSFYINPDFRLGALKTNTSMLIKIKGIDPDGDDYMGRVLMYYGTENESSTGWTELFKSEQEIIFNDIDTSIEMENVTLRIEIKDEFSSSVNFLQFELSILDNGTIEYGDGAYFMKDLIDFPTGEGGTGVTPSEEMAGTEKSENVINVGIKEVEDITNMSSTMIWLIVMLLVGGGILFSGYSRESPKTAFAVIGLAQVGLIIIGSLLGFFSIGILITIIVVSIAILGLLVSRIIFGQTN